jgi:hypothetical protein
MTRSKRKDLAQAVEEIQARFVDCSPCPPERNCCQFNSYFYNQIDRRELTAMFSRKTIKGLMARGSLQPDTPDASMYLLTETCPNLDDKYRCRIHKRKSDLNLVCCLHYPINEHDNIVRVDYRCYSVERNWPEIHAQLVLLPEEVTVRYWNGEKHTRTDLDRFSCIHSQGLPSQHLPGSRRTPYVR